MDDGLGSEVRSQQAGMRLALGHEPESTALDPPGEVRVEGPRTKPVNATMFSRGRTIITEAAQAGG